jgi:hypothetical protein
MTAHKTSGAGEEELHRKIVCDQGSLISCAKLTHFDCLQVGIGVRMELPVLRMDSHSSRSFLCEGLGGNFITLGLLDETHRM